MKKIIGLLIEYPSANKTNQFIYEFYLSLCKLVIAYSDEIMKNLDFPYFKALRKFRSR